MPADGRRGRVQQRVKLGLIEKVDLLIVVLGRRRLVDGAARVATAPALGYRELKDAVEVHVEIANRLHR